MNTPSLRPSWSPGNGHLSSIVKVSDMATLVSHWSWVRDRLQAIRRRDPTCDLWHPTHIKNMLIEGFKGNSPVELWFGVTQEDNPVIEGFAITTLSVDPFVHLPRAWVIWLGWMNMAMMKQHMPAFENIAREREYPAIEFMTGRRGWWFSDKPTQLGFGLDRQVYRKEIA